VTVRTINGRNKPARCTAVPESASITVNRVGDSQLYLSLYMFLVFRQLGYSQSSLDGTQPKTACHMFESGRDLKVHVQKLGHPIPINIGAPYHKFSTFSTTFQLNKNYSGEYFTERNTIYPTGERHWKPRRLL